MCIRDRIWTPLLLVALYDVMQSHHSLRRNYPLIARIRWFFEALRPFLYALSLIHI